MNSQHIALEVSQDEHYRSPYLKALKENWPSLAKDYRHFCHVMNPQVGDIWVWTSPEGQKFFHLILDSEEHVLRSEAAANRLQSFKKALKKIKKVSVEEEIKNIELPRIGFHFSEAELDLAQGVVKEIFMDCDVKVDFV